MEYVGKKLQAGQLALGSPVHSAVKEKPEGAPCKHWAVTWDHTRGLAYLWAAAQIDATIGGRVSADFGNHCWQRWMAASAVLPGPLMRGGEGMFLYPVLCKEGELKSGMKSVCDD